MESVDGDVDLGFIVSVLYRTENCPEMRAIFASRDPEKLMFCMPVLEVLVVW